MNPSKKVQVLQIAKNTSIDLLEKIRSLHNILETCQEICKLLEISYANTWLDLEINGYLIKFKTRDELCVNLPSYRKTRWKFYDLYGNLITLPPSVVELFGKSTVYHPIQELENNVQIIIEAQFLDKLNNFISEHGMNQASKNLRIHEARISQDEIKDILIGIQKRIEDLLDTVIAILELE